MSSSLHSTSHPSARSCSRTASSTSLLAITRRCANYDESVGKADLPQASGASFVSVSLAVRLETYELRIQAGADPAVRPPQVAPIRLLSHTLGSVDTQRAPRPRDEPSHAAHGESTGAATGWAAHRLGCPRQHGVSSGLSGSRPEGRPAAGPSPRVLVSTGAGGDPAQALAAEVPTVLQGASTKSEKVPGWLAPCQLASKGLILLASDGWMSYTLLSQAAPGPVDNCTALARVLDTSSVVEARPRCASPLAQTVCPAFQRLQPERVPFLITISSLRRCAYRCRLASFPRRWSTCRRTTTAPEASF